MKLYTHKITVTYNIEGTLTDFDFIGQDEVKTKAETKAHEKWHRFAILDPAEINNEPIKFKHTEKVEELPQYIIDFFTTDILK